MDAYSSEWLFGSISVPFGMLLARLKCVSINLAMSGACSAEEACRHMGRSSVLTELGDLGELQADNGIGSWGSCNAVCIFRPCSGSDSSCLSSLDEL